MDHPKPAPSRYERHGDKENSPFFEEYLERIYERRESSGLTELLGEMRGIVLQVSAGEALPYFLELYLMSPYRLSAAYRNETHQVYVFAIDPAYPTLFVLEPLEKSYGDLFTAIDALYPRGKAKPNARYLGEIYRSKDIRATQQILEAEEMRFLGPDTIRNTFLQNPAFAFTERSYFTNNIVGYAEKDLADHASLGLGTRVELSADILEKLQRADEVYRKLGFSGLIRGIDHLATRVFSGDREHAILEFLTLSPYYFWGAYNIVEMNSSTNVTRFPGLLDELLSPAKVFTANNTPYYVNSLTGLPSPTEDFVRNFGRRMHHVAYEVVDGTRKDGMKNIDYVVSELAKADIPFLADIIGKCDDFPDLKQIFSKSSSYSFLITEYVQRCHGFEGFFTKTNVARLTEAAGEDEALKKADIFD